MCRPPKSKFKSKKSDLEVCAEEKKKNMSDCVFEKLVEDAVDASGDHESDSSIDEDCYVVEKTKDELCGEVRTTFQSVHQPGLVDSQTESQLEIESSLDGRDNLDPLINDLHALSFAGGSDVSIEGRSADFNCVSQQPQQYANVFSDGHRPYPIQAHKFGPPAMYQHNMYSSYVDPSQISYANPPSFFESSAVYSGFSDAQNCQYL